MNWRRRNVMAIVGILAFIGLATLLWYTDIINEIVYRDSMMAPVLVMEVDFDSDKTQSASFVIKYSGTYSVNAQLTLRAHDREGVPTFNDTVVLEGIAEITCQDRGTLALRRVISRKLLDREVLLKLFHFNAAEVGGKGEKTFSVTFNPTRQFRAQYSRMTIYVRREPKFQLAY